jgi:hypothetical protein
MRALFMLLDQPGPAEPRRGNVSPQRTAILEMVSTAGTDLESTEVPAFSPR